MRTNEPGGVILPAMVDIDLADLGTALDVNTGSATFSASIVEKPFYDPKKRIAAAA